MRYANVRATAMALSSLVLVLLTASVAAGQGESTDAGVSRERLLRIGQMIDRRIDDREVPGAVALVAIDGRIVHFEARGQLDLESRKPMPKDAIFSLASLTKPVTAAAVLMLVEEGRVRLTDPVSQFIPEFKDLKVAVSPSQTVPASRPITIRDLLTHTSGLVAPPRTPTEPAATQRFARRYDVVPGGLKPFERFDPPSYFGGGWGLYSTAQDYFRFAQMLLNGGEFEGERLLSPRAVELMSGIHIPDTLPGRQPGEGWGLGVRVISSGALRTSWLSNGSVGWSGASGTHFWIDPEKHLVGILMAQAPAAGFRPDFETIVMQAVVQ